MAEKKTVKKSVAKEETKKVETNTMHECECKECNCGCNCGCNCSQKLNYILYCCIAILALVIILLGVVIANNTKNTSETSDESSESSTEYDVSMFDTLTTTDAIAKISKGDKVLVYIGRSNCGYCVKFLPSLQKAQKEFGYKTVYVDLNQVSTSDQEAWAKFGGVAKLYDETCTDPENATVENKCGKFGLTPMVLVFENGKLKDDWVGYSEYEQFASFLTENGFKK